MIKKLLILLFPLALLGVDEYESTFNILGNYTSLSCLVCRGHLSYDSFFSCAVDGCESCRQDFQDLQHAQKGPCIYCGKEIRGTDLDFNVHARAKCVPSVSPGQASEKLINSSEETIYCELCLHKFNSRCAYDAHWDNGPGECSKWGSNVK